MRKLAPLALLLGIACATTPPATAPAPQEAAEPYGMTVAEEARILALEDRREYDPALAAEWIKHPNPLHRKRIALALGRIGPHVFVDKDNDREQDANEPQAGVTELLDLASDSDRNVREAVAFALGEIGDGRAGDALFAMTADADAGVAAEAIEAISKLAADATFSRERITRYSWLVDPKFPEGLRARAVRFLFRFNSDTASDLAVAALESPSSAVRQEAAYTLARKPDSRARLQLELLLTDPNVLTRAYASSALGRIGEAASTQPLLTTLGDVHPWVRTNAALALSRIFDKDTKGVRADDLPRIVAALEDPDPGVRANTIDILGFYAKSNATAQARLFDVSKNGTQSERELAAREAMQHLGYRLANDGLPRPYSPWATAQMIDAFGDPPFLREKYGNHESPIVRAMLVSKIPNGSVDTELETVKRYLQDPDVIVRTNAIERYTHATKDDSRTWVSTLEGLVESEKTSELNDARLAAITALAEFDRPQRAIFLRSLLTDNDPVVRRLAADLIVSKLGAKRPQYTPLPVTRTQAEYEEIVRWSRQPHTATIHMPRGRIELALLSQEAPVTAWNFAQLAQKKYFDNTSFMRVVPNFVIQGGDPRNDQNGGPGYAIRDEINLQKYTRGAVGMALSGPDTGGSQFFITHSPQPHLDGGYTIFARVYEGMNGVVDQVERGDKVSTIAIDEHPPVGVEQVSSIPNVSLPLIIGPVTVEQIETTVPTYAQKKAEYQPDITVIEMMKSYVRAGDRMEVYMGTWCPDSEREVPKLLKIHDELKSQFGVELPVQYIAVDKSKRQPAQLLAGKSLAKIATFIYYRGDRELGRIEERPSGLFEDDLLTLAAKQ